MKKVLLLIILLVSGIQVFAQVTDIKYLVNKTPQEMVSLYDNSKIVTGEYYDFEIEKAGFFIGYYSSDDSSLHVARFSFSSSAFCVFSDYIVGGIKIGDSIERLQSIDFVHTPYGRGREGNALVPSENNWFHVYEMENAYFGFKVENGYITKIYYTELEDCNPNNINPNSPFGN